MSIILSIYLMIFLLNIALAARFNTVGSQNQDQYIRLKSQYDLLPGKVVNLPIEVPQEYITLNGLLSPRIKSISSPNLDGIYGTGDIILIDLEYSSRVGVYQSPSLTLNTGCHDASCTIIEKQMFTCAADRGMFAIRLEDEFLMNIDVNTTKEELKKLIQNTFTGINVVTITYSDAQNRTYNQGNRACSSIGNIVTISFDDVSFSQYNGDVPLLQVDATNTYPDIHNGINVGINNALLQGVPPHSRRYTPKLSAVTELVKGLRISDATAPYDSGDQSSMIRFKYVVKNGDFTEHLEVKLLNYSSGYVYGLETNVPISTDVPHYGSGSRYMSPVPSALGFNHKLVVTSAQPQITSITSPNINAVYTQGDIILIHLIYNLPVKVFDANKFLLQLSTGSFDRQIPFIQLISGNTILEFKYIVQEGDTSTDLDYSDSMSLSLNGGYIFRDTSTNETVASISLPLPGSIGSLSFNKMLVINTLSPQIVSVNAVSREGIYTGGDLIDFQVLYGNAIHVEGRPRLLIQNTPSLLNANILTAPFNPNIAFKRAKPGLDAQILITVSFNWDLLPGDEIYVSLPGFFVRNEPVNGILDFNRTLYLQVRFNDKDQSSQFSGVWQGFDETLSITSHDSLPRNTDITIIVDGSTGLFTPSNGLYSSKFDAILSVASSNSVDVSFTKNYKFEYITSIGFEFTSLDIKPLMPGALVTYLVFTFNVSEPLEIGDTIILHLDGLKQSTAHSFTNLLFSGFYLSWYNGTYEFKLEVVSNSSELSHSIDLLGNGLSFSVPNSGIKETSITVSANMQHSGQLSHSPLLSLSPICSVVEPTQNTLPTVKYLTKLPAMSSSVIFEWQNGFKDLLIGDSVMFELPDYNHAVGTTSRSISALYVLGLSSRYFQVEIAGRKVTFKVVDSIPRLSLVSIMIDQSAGLVVPTNGIRPLVDSFTFLLRSTSCNMLTAMPILFSYDAHIILVKSPEVILTTMSGILKLGESVTIDISFEISENLETGDMFKISVPDFSHDFLSHPNGIHLISNANLTLKMNFLLQLLEFTVMSTFNVVTTSTLQLSIDYSQGLFLPKSSLSSDAFRLTVISNNVLSLENMLMKSSCSGFCRGEVVYSTQFLNETLVIEVNLAFSADLIGLQPITFQMNGFKLSSGISLSGLLYVDNSANFEMISFIKWNHSTITKLKTLELLLPSYVSALTNFKFVIIGLELFENTDDLSNNFAVLTENKVIGNSSFVLNYPKIPIRKFYFIQSKLMFSQAMYISDISYSNVTLTFQLPSTLILDEGNFVEVTLPGFLFNYKLNYDSYTDFLIANMRSQTDSYHNVIDLDRSTVTLNEETTVIKLYFRYKLFGDETLVIKIENVAMPKHGVSNDENVNGISYKIGLSSVLITATQYFTDIQEVLAITDVSVDFSFASKSNFSLNNITVAFYSSSLIHLGDSLQIQIPGLEMKNVSKNEVTVELLSSSFHCNVKWFQENSTIQLSPKSSSLSIGMQHIVINVFHPHRFYIKSTGISDNTDAVLSLYSIHLDVAATGNYRLPCIAICSAVVIPEVRKAGFPTNYDFVLNFVGIEFSTADKITMKMEGFSMKNYNSMNISSIDLANNKKFALKLSMDLNSMILSLDFTEAFNKINIDTLSFVIPQSFGLISPPSGIRSNYLFDVSIWTFSPSLNRLEPQYSNKIGSVSVIGKIKTSSFLISPKIPGSVAQISFSFRFFDELLSGDCIRIYLPSFHVPTYHLVNTDFTSNVLIEGINDNQNVFSNPDGSRFNVDHISQLRVTLLQNIEPEKELTFSIGNFSQILIPKTGVYHISTVPWIAVESGTSPIASAHFINYTRIGSLSPAVLNFKNSSGAMLNIDLHFTIACPLFTNDIILIHVFNLVPDLLSIPKVNARSKALSALNFTGNWDSLTSEIKLTIVNGTYIMSGTIMIELTLEGFYAKNEISYLNDKRNTVRLQSSICPFESTSFDKSNSLFLSDASISFDKTTSITQPTSIKLSFTPVVELHPFDVLVLKLPHFYMVNDTLRSFNISSNGVFYDSGIANYSLFLNEISIYAIIKRPVFPETLVFYEILKSANNAIYFPSTGLSEGDTNIELKLLRPSNGTTDLMNLTCLTNSIVIFQGYIQNIQPVMYFYKKAITIGNPRPGTSVTLSIEWVLSQSIASNSVIIIELPGFVCNKIELLLDGSAKEYFTASWNKTSSSIYFTNVIMLPKFLPINALFNFDQQFISPIDGLPQVNVKYFISVMLNKFERVREEIQIISIIPNVKASLLSFLSSESSDCFNIAGNPYVIQLKPGHEFTEQDQGAQIIVSGDFYTIQAVANNLIYLLEPYNGIHVFMGYPAIPIYTPPYRFADYFSGSGSTSLIFQYRVRRGDNSTALILFKPTTDYNTNNADETLDLNHGFLLRDSNSPSLAADLNIPIYNRDTQRSINSEAPFITKFYISSPTGVYSVGQQIDFQIQYSERVLVGAVNGSVPELLLKIMPSGKIIAHYKSGSGTNTLVFTYSVSVSDFNKNIDSSIISVNTPIYQPLRVITGNAYNYIRRYSDEALIDTTVDIDLNGMVNIDIPYNISLVGNAIKVQSIWTPMHRMGSTFSVGDNIMINVLFTDTVLVNPGSTAPFILLEVGRNVPGIASYHSKYNDSTLSFVYEVLKEDELFNGLFLHCTCLDYFQRTFIQLGSSLIVSAKSSDKVSVLLASSSSAMDRLVTSHSTFIIDKDIPYILGVNSNLSSDPSIVYSPGTIASISVKFSKPVTIRGLLRIWMKAQLKPCPARYFEGNNSDTLTFLYFFTEVSGVSTLDYVNINAFDTSMGEVYRYSDHPSMLANTILPKPGTPESLGLRSPSSIDTSLISLDNIDVIQNRKVGNMPYFSANSLSFNLYPSLTNNSYQYFPRKMLNSLLPVSFLFQNCSINDIKDLWRKYSSQNFDFLNDSWIGELGVKEYNRMQISVISQNQILFLPQFRSLMSLQAAYFDSYWWTNVQVRSDIELSFKFSRPVLLENAFIELNTGSASILNRAFSNKFVHQYFLTVQSTSPYDINGKLIGSIRQNYRLKYSGYLTRCISVTADAKSVYSLQMALEEISALLILEPNVILMYTQNTGEDIISYYRIDFVNLPMYELQVITGAELGDSCILPVFDDQVKLDKENSSVTFTYDIKGDNSIVFKAHSILVAGDYTVFIDASNLIGISAGGINPHSFQLRRYDINEQYIAKSNIFSATAVPQVRKSALAFSSSIPNTLTAIHINLCFDIVLNISDKVIVHLYDFNSVWENQILQQISLLSNSGNVNFIWNHQLSTLQLVILKNNLNCISENVEVSFGFVLPSRSIYQNSLYFTFEIQSASEIGVKLPPTLFEFVSPVGIGSFSIAFSDPRPYHPTSLLLDFSLEVDTMINNTFSSYNSSTLFELYLPGFHTENGYSGELTVSSDLSVYFTTYWSNFTSTLSIWPMGSMSKGEYKLSILSEESDRFRLFFPSTGLYKNNPPLISFISDQWSSVQTAIHDIPYIYGHEGSFINITLSNDLSSYSVKSIIFGVNFSRPIDGPAFLNITMPFLSSKISKVVLDSSDKMIWYDWEKTLCVSKVGGWPLGFTLVELFDLTGFSVNEQGVPLKRVSSGITFSVVGTNGFLHSTDVSYVTRIPVIQYSSVSYSSMSNDIFSSDKQSITINIKLNLPSLPLDMFFFDLSGIQALNESNAVISDPCVSINEKFWSHYISEPHTLVIFLLNSSICMHRKLEYTWIINEKTNSNIDLRSVVQYNSGGFEVSWVNTYRNIQDFKVVDYPTLGLTASSLEFSNPCAGQATDMIIRLLTASVLLTNDVIHMQIPHVIFNLSNTNILDQYGRKWLVHVENVENGYSNISFVSPQKFNQTSLYFHITNCILSSLGIEAYTKEITISLKRGNHMLIKSQAISKFLTPVGYINSFTFYPVRSVYFQSGSLNRMSSLGFMVIIDTLSVLSTGDIIYIKLNHYNFYYDADLIVDGKDSSVVRVRAIQNKNILEVTILESIDNTLLQFTILPNEALDGSNKICLKNLCDVFVSIDSKSNPVCYQKFESMEIFTLPNSMFRIFQNNTNTNHRNVSLEILISFRNIFRKGSVLSIHVPDFYHKDIYFSFVSFSQSQWNLTQEGKLLNQTIQLKAMSDILPENSTQRIVLESNIFHSSSHIIYENDPSIYYQVFPEIESVHHFQYYSEIGHFATTKSFGLKNSSLVLSNLEHGHKTAVMIDLQSDLNSNFHVGDNISIALKYFVLFTGMNVEVNTTNNIAVLWNPVTETINIYVHETCTSINLVVYWFVLPLMGSNLFSSLPTISISTIDGSNFIDSNFNVFKQLAPQLKVQILFSRLLVSQESIISILLNGDMHLKSFDQISIYLPQFWCSRRALTVNSTSNSFIATWDVSGEILTLQSMNLSDTTFLMIEVEGLRIPYNGISPILLDFVTFQSNSTRNGYIEVSNVDMQLIGSVVYSTLLFSPGRLDVLNDLQLTFELNIPVQINGTINLHLPGFVINTIGGLMINSSCALNDELIVAKEQLYQVDWNTTVEILSLKAILRSLDPFESCVVIIKNTFQLPSNGIFLATNPITTQQSLSLYQKGYGSFDPTPITQVHFVGFISASLSYDKFMDSDDYISFKVEFYPSVQIEVGDRIVFYIPLINSDDTSSIINLSVLGDQAEKNFIPSFTAQFHRTRNEIVLTAVAIESSRYISISVTKDNSFRFVNDASKYENDIHYISGELLNIGNITKREIEHSPKNFYGIQSKLITLSNCSSTHTSYYNDYRGCLIRLDFTVYSSLQAGESLVLSHTNLYRPQTSYDGRLNNHSSLVHISTYRPSLDYNIILNISGNAADLITSYWRPADNVNNLLESSEEIYSIDSHALAFARTDLSFYEINKTFPSNIFPGNIQIVSHIPRIINVYIQHKHSTGDYISCEDVVEIVINFDVSVSVRNPEKLSLILNTGEVAGYNHGNQSSSLYFAYNIVSPIDVLDLEILGPGALEYYLPDTTSVFSSENSLIPANLTIPQPFNQLFLEDNQFKQMPVTCKLTAFVTEVSTSYSSRFSIYATNDVMDIQVIFNRPITVTGNPYLILSSSHILNPVQFFIARFVNVSNIQWLDVPLDGVFKLMYEGQTTPCMDVRNTTDIHLSISKLTGLKYSLPLDVSRFVVKNGYRYKLEFRGLAPSIISLSIFTCGYYEVLVKVTMDKSLYNTAIFRYSVQSGDEANLLTYPNDSALVLPSDSIIYLTGRSVSTRVNVNLPNPSSSNSLLISSGVRIRTESPFVLSVYSNYTRPTALQSGDVVYILVNYSAPVVVIEPEIVMLELNISSTLPTMNDSIILEKLSLCFVFENILYFKYIVKMGDYAKYLTTSNINMLYGTNQSILLKSINPITPASLILPSGNVLFNGLTQSKVIVNAIALPTVLSVFTNHSVGTFNTGEEIFITIQFSATVNVFELITDHKAYPKSSPYISFISPEDGYMLYVAGSGTSNIVFKYSVGEIKEKPSANISFHINLLQGYFQDRFYRNFTELLYQNHQLFQIADLVVSSQPAYVIKVDVTNPNGTYYPGETLDLFVVFSEPVLLLGGYRKPALELFLPTQSGSDLLAIYSSGNGTNEIHFEYVIPSTNFNFLQQAPFVLDYSNADGLYKYMYGTKFTDISTHPTTEANVYLPTKDHSFLTHHRLIFVDFSICKILSVFSDSDDGIYTAGDAVSISVLFTSPVMIFYPPVLKLATGKVNRSAIYEQGNGTNTLTFIYTIKIGDASALLDYIDTRYAPYSLDYPDQTYPLNTAVIPSINALVDNETDIFLEASIFGGIYMLSSSTDASKRVAVYTALPIPGQQGSLSKSSKIVIDTTAPFIELVTTTLTSGTYGHNLSIPIYMLFNFPVTIIGCPYIIFKVNGLDKTAPYTTGNNSELVQFHYLVQPDDVVYSFDYFDRFSLRLATCPQSPITSVNSILRFSENPQIFANLTMPWVRYIESVISPVSIVGSGKDLNIIAPSENGPRLIWSSLSNIRNYSLGDVIDVNIGFGGSIIFPMNAYLNMKNERIVDFASQVNDTTVMFPLVVQHLETLAGLSYPDPFSLISLSSCAIISSQTNECVPQNLPIPFSTSPESSIDALSQLKLNIVQFSIVVESVYFIPSNENTTTFYTGSVINIVVQFSEAVLVQGNPLLILYLENNLENVYFNAYFNVTQSSPINLVFQAIIDSSLYYGQLSCNFNSIINLNGGKIVREANFLPFVAAFVNLGYVCCKDDCNVYVEVESKVPVVMDVYSPQKGVYSLGERIDIFVKFNAPIKVIGLLAMKLELYGMPSAIYVKTAEDNLVLQFMYVIKETDYTSSLDYQDINSLIVASNGPYDGIFLLCPSGNITAILTLPTKGSQGSLGRESNIVINTNRPNLLTSFANPSRATSGDELYITLRYSEAMIVVNNQGVLFSMDNFAINLDYFLGLSLDFIPTDISEMNPIQKRTFTYFETSGTDITFRYQVQPSDPTGFVYFSSSSPILFSNSYIKSALTGTTGPSEFSVAISTLLLATIDNNIPYVLQVYSPNKSSFYPFGVGDVIDIYVEMSLSIIVKEVPYLRLVLDNGMIAIAHFSIDNPSPVKVLKFQYKVQEGDSAYPLEYDGNYALVGLLLRYSTYNPTIVANLYLPDPSSLGSLTYCCNLIVDSSPPHVVSLIPLKRAGVYGENEIIYIMARFSKPVIVTGNPELHLSTKVNENNEVIGIGIANFTQTVNEYDIPIDIRDTDVLFKYVVKVEDNVISLHHTDKNAIKLNKGALIQHLTNNPTLLADILLRSPGDFTVQNGLVERQWKFRFPTTVEILLRDLYHTKADSISATLEHSGKTAILFKKCCSKKTFGYSYPKTRSGTNSTLQSLDTGIGEDFLFSDLVSSNIALQGIALQSSTRLSARLAIDGNTDPLVGDNSVSETIEQDNAWWQITLPINSTVQSITIWPRKPQNWINPVVQLTIKSFERYSDGKYRLRIQNIDNTDPIAEVLTTFIPMNATALQMKIILEATQGLGNVEVFREELPLCPQTGQGCGAGGYQSGFGFRYDLSFLSLQTPSPNVLMQQITFPGEDVITDPALHVPPNTRTSEFYHLIELTRTGYYIQVPEELSYGKGIQTDTIINKNPNTNEWLTPFWVFIFDSKTNSPPNDLNASINSSIWYQRYEQIENSLNIVLTIPMDAKFVKVQREGFGSLSLAELQIFKERIDSLAYYNQGSPVRPSTLSSPYQPDQTFKNTFGQLQFDGNWIVQLSQDDSIVRSPLGWSGSSGSISEAVLIITDLAGIVHSYYQDLRAEVLSLPKYGTLFVTTAQTPSPYGDWREAFEIDLESRLQAKDGGERYLGYCFGPDSSGNSSTINVNQTYTSCTSNFGVGPLLNLRILGDTAATKYLRNERIIVYRPRTDYLGPDVFTYIIHDGLNIQRHEYFGGVQSSNNEVLIHIRRCRPFQSHSQYALTATQSSSFTNDGHHVLCTCAQTESSMIGNRVMCDAARLAVCNSVFNTTDPVNGHRQFLALCLTCTDPLRGLNSSDCQTQTIRAVSLLTSRNLCVPSVGSNIDPVMDCSMETFTEPGKESNNYLTIKPPVLFGSFQRLKNSFGAYGWYHTPQLN